MTDVVELKPLDKSALTVRRLRVLIGTGVVFVVLVAAVLLLLTLPDTPTSLWIGPALVVVVGAASWWWEGVEYSRWAWRLTPDLFEVRRGVVFRRVNLVPRSRIQNVTTKAGPLQRRFGVLTLAVHTAGTRTKSVEILDIGAGHAEEIRRQLGLA